MKKNVFKCGKPLTFVADSLEKSAIRIKPVAANYGLFCFYTEGGDAPPPKILLKSLAHGRQGKTNTYYENAPFAYFSLKKSTPLSIERGDTSTFVNP